MLVTPILPNDEQPLQEALEYGRRTGLRMSILALVFAGVLVLAFFLVNGERRHKADELAAMTKVEMSKPPPVDVISATLSRPTRRLVLPGETAAWHDSRIYARVSGYVENWFVDIGDRVTKGQTLALIETPEVDAQLRATRAKLSAAQAEVNVKQANADFAKSTYERWNGSPQGVVSEQEQQSKRASSLAAEAELIAFRAKVTLDQAEVERLTTLTEFKEVKAPFDGTIVERNIDIGDLVTAGSGSAMSALYRVARIEPIRVFVNVPQSAADDLLTGDTRVSITVGDDTSRHYDGTLARTSRAINRQSRTLRAEIDLPNSDSRLVPGLYVQVSFALKRPVGVQVPASALLFRPKPQVAIIDAKNVLEFREVKIGSDDGDVVQIELGLQEGDKVALNLSSQITSGMKVDAHELGVRLSERQTGALVPHTGEP